jgi:hypothetical protein
MSDFAELIATVEQVRAERYPQLAPDLVLQVLTIEATQPDDRSAAMREIKQAVLAALPASTARGGRRHA